MYFKDVSITTHTKRSISSCIRDAVTSCTDFEFPRGNLFFRYSIKAARSNTSNSWFSNKFNQPCAIIPVGLPNARMTSGHAMSRPCWAASFFFVTPFFFCKRFFWVVDVFCHHNRWLYFFLSFSPVCFYFYCVITGPWRTIISHRIIPYQYNKLSYRIIQYHTIYHTVPYQIVSYHIIYCIGQNRSNIHQPIRCHQPTVAGNVSVHSWDWHRRRDGRGRLRVPWVFHQKRHRRHGEGGWGSSAGEFFSCLGVCEGGVGGEGESCTARLRGGAMSPNERSVNDLIYGSLA